LALVLIFTLIFHQRQDDNILMEIVFWPRGGGDRGSPVYHFVVKDDGTFISYYGLSRSDSNRNRTSSVIRVIEERKEISLSDKEFSHISELVDRIVSGDSEGGAFSSALAMFIYDGNIYENSTAWSGALHEMIQMFFELAPLSSHSH